MLKIPPSKYIGRFAPSPSGPLHFGSLVCALASYIDAKRHGGQWLVRIEDIDPPREQPGASEQILRCLEAHGLYWDGEVRHQSERSEAYRAALKWFQQEDLLYRCTCTRKRLAPLHGLYDGYCRERPADASQPAALRVKVNGLPPKYAATTTHITFTDRIKGKVVEDLTRSGDFVVHRKDGYFAYQLAVVIDDVDQGVTHVVRGDDLLDTTAKQIYLYHLLGKAAPKFSHIPVVVDSHGNKLSKQNHAPALDNGLPAKNLIAALRYLRLPAPEPPTAPTCEAILAQVLEHLAAHDSSA